LTDVKLIGGIAGSATHLIQVLPSEVFEHLSTLRPDSASGCDFSLLSASNPAAESTTVADASDEDLQRLCLLEGLNVADASIEDLQKLLPQLRTYRILRS